MMNSNYYGGMHSWGAWGSSVMSPFWFLGLGVVGLTSLLVIFVAILALKGYALWHAAKRNEKWWFIALLVINTAGILELIYLCWVAKVWHKHRR